MSILILGANGQLGSALQEQLGEQGICCPRSAVDITSTDSIERQLDQAPAEVVINAAAYNKVDLAEDEPQEAYRINALGPRNLALLCAARGLKLVHISTDYVFGLQISSEPWTEASLPEPVSAYGISKLAGEHFVRSLCPQHFVLRTCGLYGHAGRTGTGKGNFVETMLRLAHERESLNIVNDQHCTPTSVKDLAQAILALIETEAFGLYHATNSGPCHWSAFAEEIFRHEQLKTQVVPIPSSEYRTKARRPSYSLLNCNKLQEAIGFNLRPWQTALHEYLDERNAALKSLS